MRLFTDLGVKYGKGNADHPYQKILRQYEIALRGYAAYGARAKRLALIDETWRAICQELLIPNRDRFISGSIALNEIESELADWLKHTFRAHADISVTQHKPLEAA